MARKKTVKRKAKRALQPKKKPTIAERGKGTQFKKGNPGSPGRPKKENCIPDILTKISKEEIKAQIDGRLFNRITNLEAMCRASLARAKRGDIKHIEFIAERMEGKVTQVIKTIETDLEVGFDEADA